MNAGDRGISTENNIVSKAGAPIAGNKGIVIKGKLSKATAPIAGDRCMAYPKQGGGWLVFKNLTLPPYDTISYLGYGGGDYQLWTVWGGSYSGTNYYWFEKRDPATTELIEILTVPQSTIGAGLTFNPTRFCGNDTQICVSNGTYVKVFNTSDWSLDYNWNLPGGYDAVTFVGGTVNLAKVYYYLGRYVMTEIHKYDIYGSEISGYTIPNWLGFEQVMTGPAGYCYCCFSQVESSPFRKYDFPTNTISNHIASDDTFLPNYPNSGFAPFYIDETYGYGKLVVSTFGGEITSGIRIYPDMSFNYTSFD